MANFQGEVLVKDLRTALAKQPGIRPVEVEPIALFRSLRIRASSAIKEMWAPQADALREWDRNRAAPDVHFQLNTGAGKTLIGLVAAQSLVNETRGRVVYCCATRQLVEQTRGKAEDLGIPTATYVGSEWVDHEVFLKAHGPVLTTYAALFNGKSIFRKDSIVAVVFDDSHTAHDAVRTSFTLNVERTKHGALYDAITSLSRNYFESVGREFVYEEIVSRREPSTVLMVPMFEAIRHTTDLRRIFREHGVEKHKELLFVWAHLGERLDRCVITFDSESVQLTPLLPPVDSLQIFRDGVRRLYLSATLRVNDESIRTFGVMPKVLIQPGGRAGDTERLFLLPPSGLNDVEARGWAEAASRGLKAVIMTPSWRGAKEWESHAEVFSTELGNERIRRFAASEDERLVFVARYDGIDLPDDACRVMVVDGLPSGLSLLDRFFEQHLERIGISNSRIASRFVQILGRTSRGMSDYGAVVLAGHRLLDWVHLPVHRALLPAHVQRQLQVGEQLSALVAEDAYTARELIDKCLGQAEDWAEIYEAKMADAVAEPEPPAAKMALAERLAWAERTAANALWAGDSDAAIGALLGAREDAFNESKTLGAWFLHWAGLASQLLGDMAQATDLYMQAARIKRDLGSVLDSIVVGSASDASAASPQAQRMAQLLQERGVARIVDELEGINVDLKNLSASAGVHEEAIRLLGEYLGYDAMRPEKQTQGKGPDVLWKTTSCGIVIFDAKTKKVNSSYDKDLIGKSAQHALWAEREFGNADSHHFIVGPRVPATNQATPPSGLRVLAVTELVRVASVTLSIYRRASARNLPLFYGAEIEIGLTDEAIAWDSLPKSIESVKLNAL